MEGVTMKDKHEETSCSTRDLPHCFIRCYKTRTYKAHFTN